MEFKTNPAIEKKLKLYSRNTIHQIPQTENLPKRLLSSVKAAATVFPFKVNNYVIEELIDWDNIPNDPIFQLTFPQPGMLEDFELDRMKRLIRKQASEKEVKIAAQQIQMKLNPHPAGQMDLNVPIEGGKIYSGMQHKYNETVLFFPSQGQSCHAYCTYCFRWAQFAGLDNLKFASRDAETLFTYIKAHPEVTDVLFTGGDPLTMRTRVLKRYTDRLIREKPANLSTIRIGTKSLAYWPYRFITDKDADELLQLFEQITHSGIHLSIMAHFSHSRELETPAVQTAIKRILNTGATIRCQAPLIKHINDDPDVWSTMWKTQVKLGAIPYYMFVGRDTGPKDYFKLPLKTAYQIFSQAYGTVSGLCRTVRGPSMSATQGKILIDGISEIKGEKVFVLKFIQGRDSQWANKVFFARYDSKASWLDELKPAFGETDFFYTKRLNAIAYAKRQAQFQLPHDDEEADEIECALS